jgi:hypothetical protein
VSGTWPGSPIPINPLRKVTLRIIIFSAFSFGLLKIDLVYKYLAFIFYGIKYLIMVGLCSRRWHGFIDVIVMLCFTLVRIMQGHTV